MAVAPQAMPRPSVSGDVFELADRLVELRARKEELESQLKAVNAELGEVNRQLADRMATEELQGFTRGKHQFYLRTDCFVSVVAERRDDLVAWLKAHGAGELVKETVHPQTLRAYVRELNDAGELPAELAEMVRIYEPLVVGVRKVQAREGK